MHDRPFLVRKAEPSDTQPKPYNDPIEDELSHDATGTIQRYLQLADRYLDLADEEPEPNTP